MGWVLSGRRIPSSHEPSRTVMGCEGDMETGMGWCGESGLLRKGGDSALDEDSRLDENGEPAEPVVSVP